MGYDLGLICEPPTKGLLRRSRQDAKSLATSFCDDVLSRTKLAAFSSVEDSQQGASCIVLPIEQPVEFYDRGNHVVISARTSSCGPGYHAFLIEELEKLGQQFNFEWQEHSTDDDDIIEDETGYFSDRSFDELQRLMADLLQGIAQTVDVEDTGKSLLQLSLNLGSIEVPDNHVAAPRGYFPRRSIANLVGCSREELVAFAKTYFPWWDRDLTSNSKRGIAEATLWSQFPWRSPLSSEERRQGEGIRKLLRLQNGSMQPEHLQHLNYDEFEAILDANDEVVWPCADGIGFHRGTMSWNLAGGWEIRAPGYGIFEIDEDEGLVTIDFDGGRVLATTFRVERKSKFLLDAAIADEEGYICRVKDGFAYVGDHEPYTSDDFEGCWLNGSVKGPQGFAVISILFDDPAFLSTAEEIFMSVHVPPKPEHEVLEPDAEN